MKKMIRFSLIAITALIVLSSCKKDDKSNTELLTAGSWKLVSEMEKVDNGNWVENIGSYSACELDDYIIFKTNNTYEFNEGATKCDPTDPQIETGIWAFGANEATLSVDGNPADLNELSSSTLIVSSSYTFGVNTYYSKQTFKH